MANNELRVGSHMVAVKQKIAEGGFGLIYLCVDARTGREMVLKKCGIQRQESYDIVNKEVKMLQKFASPYIVSLVSHEVSSRIGSEALLLLELCPGGHLLERLNGLGGKLLPPKKVYQVFGQLLMAMQPLHESKPFIVHRDLKLENVLFGQDGKVRLCDFGSCVQGYVYLRDSKERADAEEVISKETTQMYRSPEMVDLYLRQVLTEKSDIWALGCILYALCFLSHPFQDAGSLGILSAKVVIPKNGVVGEECHTLIMRMLDVSKNAFSFFSLPLFHLCTHMHTCTLSHIHAFTHTYTHIYTILIRTKIGGPRGSTHNHTAA